MISVVFILPYYWDKIKGNTERLHTSLSGDFGQYRTKIVRQMRRQIFRQMKGKTEKILCGFSSIFPKYLEKYARKMRAGRYETGSEGKFASRWRAKSPDALCVVLPLLYKHSQLYVLHVLL